MDISFQTVDKTLLVSTPEAKRREMGNLVIISRPRNHRYATLTSISFTVWRILRMPYRYWMNGILMSMIIDKTPVDCLVNQAQQIVSS